jgi:hypothetical protein
VKEQVIHFINKKMPGGLPKKTARALLDIEDKDYVPIIRDPQATTADSEAVFYFPGCGSERLFSQVGLATQAMLWHAGVQTVLPPGYLCCGYPQRGSGQFDKAEKMITDNRVLFHRVANTLNYLDIKTVVVSCGTCYDQLQGYQFEDIFPGCRIVDIHEYLLEKGITLPAAEQGAYLYHDPCHSPMKLQEPMKTVKALVGDAVMKSERCCGESGTLGVTRPDIAPRCAFARKKKIRKGEAALRAQGARAGGRRREDPHQLPQLPAGPQALRGRPAERPARGRLHRGRDGAQDPRRRLDAAVRAARQRRRHRARAGLTFSKAPAGPLTGCRLCGGSRLRHRTRSDHRHAPAHRAHRAPGLARARDRLRRRRAASASPSS